MMQLHAEKIGIPLPVKGLTVSHSFAIIQNPLFKHQNDHAHVHVQGQSFFAHVYLRTFVCTKESGKKSRVSAKK